MRHRSTDDEDLASDSQFLLTGAMATENQRFKRQISLMVSSHEQEQHQFITHQTIDKRKQCVSVCMQHDCMWKSTVENRHRKSQLVNILNQSNQSLLTKLKNVIVCTMECSAKLIEQNVFQLQCNLKLCTSETDHAFGHCLF